MIYLYALLIFIAGIIIGALLFVDTKPRKPLSIRKTKNGWDAHEIAGLLASVIVQKLPGFMPKVILETDKTIVFEHPKPKYKIHYMFVPKRDIKNIGELSEEDREYLIDLFSSMAKIINDLNTDNYRIMSNGPAKQDVAYLHFHFWSD